MNGFGHILYVPNLNFSRALLRSPETEHLTRIVGIDELDRLGTVVSGINLARKSRGTGINQTNGLVLATASILIAFHVPYNVVNEIAEIVKACDGSAIFNVPNLYRVIGSRTEQTISRRRVVAKECHLFPMGFQVRHGFFKFCTRFRHSLLVGRFPIIGNGPNLDVGVFRCCGQHGIIKGVPFHIQDTTRMPGNLRTSSHFVTTRTIQTAHHHGATTSL
mmetsp:Transcript_8769/g.16811  ORF Transcript_8769/g.16811 Transcript_8769/m.16811 type:complete len:219 (+) Transcript_8769:695-1351(+)